MNKKKFSIIIPALNEEKQIFQVIESLKKQTIDRDLFEIIVVDNNSTDKTFECATTAGADKVIKEIIKGTNIARQRGVNESNGEIIAFLDADCIAPEDWLAKIESNLSKENVLVSGPYEHNFTGLTKHLDYIYHHYMFPVIPKILQGIFRKKAGIIVEGNFATWRYAIDKIGGLPPIVFYGDGPAIAMLISRKVGKIYFDNNMYVQTSARRFKKNVFMPVIRYAVAYLKMYFAKEYWS